MPKKPTAKGTPNLAAAWSRLHGTKLPAKVADLIEGSGDSDHLQELGALPDTENTFRWSVEQSQDANRLPLWTAFVNLVPARMLDNGDIAYVYVHREGTATPVVVWDHERDVPAWVATEQVDNLEQVEPGALEVVSPSPAAQSAMRFTHRAAYIVEALSRGRFELDQFLVFNHPPVEMKEPLPTNIKAFPPTALYILWHLYFSKQDAMLEQALVLAEQSDARLIHDCALLLREVLAGKTMVGTTDVAKIRDKAATIINDPATRQQAQAREVRARVDAQVAKLQGPIRFLKQTSAVAGVALTPPVSDGQMQELGAEYAVSVVRTERPPIADLVLSVRGPSGEWSAASPVRITDSGLPITLQYEPACLGIGPNHVLLWRLAKAQSPNYPMDGQVAVHAIVDGRLKPLFVFPMDVAQVGVRDGQVVVVATDGTEYVVMESDDAP